MRERRPAAWACHFIYGVWVDSGVVQLELRNSR
jgi:hypothetical protein